MIQVSNRLSVALLMACVAAPVLLSGCRVTDNKNGKNEDVNINVPFASMHVKTNDNADVAGIGLTRYPGSVPVKDDDDKNNDGADINMSFGNFHLGVKAASYQTPDAPSKVEAFYRQDMAKYGEVIECQGSHTIGQPTRTSQGLTCDDAGKHNHIHTSSNDSDGPELRAGSPTHEHIVAIEAKNGGTKIGLVMLDLPKDTDSHNNDSE